MAAPTRPFPVERKDLFLPPLADLALVLAEGLKTNFKEVKVEVVNSPDLTLSPWHLAATGIGGSPKLMDIGGVPYLIPTVNKDKIYDLTQMADIAGVPDPFIFGAGAGSWRVKGVNCEDGSAVIEKYNSTETGPLVNVMVCEGKPGLVLEVRAEIRTGNENFVSCMRKTLQKKYGERPVALGGVFLIEKGKAKLHVMPNFSALPLLSDEDVNSWLHFYEMPSPLICLSEFVSQDPGLDLRVEHTHCFSNHGAGGHYHCDVTPNEVAYHGYFTVAEEIIRIDRPFSTHQIGRD